jgi:hypothetical protein
VVQKYLGRWSIEVFFKEAKQRLGLGQEQGRSFAAQVFSITQAFFRYSLLAYLLEHDDQSQTIGEMFRQLEEETGKLTFLERLWQDLATFLKTFLSTLANFCDSVPQLRAYFETYTNFFNKLPPLRGKKIKNLTYTRYFADMFYVRMAFWRSWSAMSLHVGHRDHNLTLRQRQPRLPHPPGQTFLSECLGKLI